MISWIGARFDFQAHGRTFAAPVKLRVHRFQDAARFLFFQIEVAVARDAERGGGKNFVAVVEPVGEGAHDVVQKNVFDGALRRREQHEPRQRARHGDDAEIGLRAAALAS